MRSKVKIYSAGGIDFKVRPDTSDVKSIKEVVEDRGYRRVRPFQFDVEKGEAWIDLGANIGAFTAYALERGAKLVVAVEPDPESSELVKMNVERYGEHRYEILHVAVVADDRPTATLHQNTAHGNVWRNSIEREWKGGESCTVPCMHIATMLSAFSAETPVCIKMDIEGTEMPILEWLVEHPEYFGRIQKLTFEWSFDVDPDLVRFRRVMTKLKNYFDVVPENMYEGHDSWPTSWFPPCKTIYALRK